MRAKEKTTSEKFSRNDIFARKKSRLAERSARNGRGRAASTAQQYVNYGGVRVQIHGRDKILCEDRRDAVARSANPFDESQIQVKGGIFEYVRRVSLLFPSEK